MLLHPSLLEESDSYVYYTCIIINNYAKCFINYYRLHDHSDMFHNGYFMNNDTPHVTLLSPAVIYNAGTHRDAHG